MEFSPKFFCLVKIGFVYKEDASLKTYKIMYLDICVLRLSVVEVFPVTSSECLHQGRL